MKKLRPTVCGVGINDGKYPVKVKNQDGTFTLCPYYRTWVSMLGRCYDPKRHAHRPSYVGCTVDSRWHLFSNFRAWMEQQDWKNKQLDKDLLVRGNKVYGPDTCVFVTPAMNNLLTLCDVPRGQYAKGVSMNTIKGTSYYVATCSMYGKQKRLGYFSTEEEASQAYIKAKAEYVREIAANEPNPRLRDALLSFV